MAKNKKKKSKRKTTSNDQKVTSTDQLPSQKQTITNLMFSYQQDNTDTDEHAVVNYLNTINTTTINAIFLPTGWSDSDFQQTIIRLKHYLCNPHRMNNTALTKVKSLLTEIGLTSIPTNNKELVQALLALSQIHKHRRRYKSFVEDLKYHIQKKLSDMKLLDTAYHGKILERTEDYVTVLSRLYAIDQYLHAYRDIIHKHIEAKKIKFKNDDIMNGKVANKLRTWIDDQEVFQAYGYDNNMDYVLADSYRQGVSDKTIKSKFPKSDFKNVGYNPPTTLLTAYTQLSYDDAVSVYKLAKTYSKFVCDVTKTTTCVVSDITDINNVPDIWWESLRIWRESMREYWITQPKGNTEYWVDGPGWVIWNTPNQLTTENGDSTATTTQDTQSSEIMTACKNGALLPHQRQVIEQIGASPNQFTDRLLVQHRVGAGKTRTMIGVLDSYFDDPRTKIIVTPTTLTRTQFYAELLDMKTSRYANWARASRIEDLQNRLEDGREPRRMRSNSGYCKWLQEKGGGHVCTFARNNQPLTHPAGPMLVMTMFELWQISEHVSKQQSQSRLSMGGVAAWFERGIGSLRNPFANKVLIIDEFHKLFEEPKPVLIKNNTRLMVDYSKCRDYLSNMHGSVMCALSATIDTKNPEVRKVLTPHNRFDIDKITHTFDGRDSRYFLQQNKKMKTITVEPDGGKRAVICGVFGSTPETRSVVAKQPYYNRTTCNFDSAITRREIDGFKEISQNVSRYAPLIADVLKRLPTRLVSTCNGTVVLCNKRGGMGLLWRLLRHKKIPFYLFTTAIYDGRNTDSMQIPEQIELSQFREQWQKECNALDISRRTVLLVDTDHVREGINLVGVDKVYNIAVFTNEVDKEQALGRADRMCTQVYMRKPNTTTLTIVDFVLDENDGQPKK